jgi:hypothetical protein
VTRRRRRCHWAALWISAALSNAVHADTLLVKGAWPSANDTTTPQPEGGSVSGGAYENAYFGLTYDLASGWGQQWEGPPPSESGFYVLAQIEPTDRTQRSIEGHALIAAQDMFFAATPAADAAELINYSKQHLDPEFRIERQPTAVRIAQRDFVQFEYRSPISQLHWQVLATQVRCHILEFVFTGRDPARMKKMIKGLQALRITERGSPVCIKDFAVSDHLIAREEPVLPQSRFNPIPVRVIIGANGRIAHIHVISAFPEQAKGISDALAQWRFKPYVVNGQATPVETGIMFGYETQRQAQNAP